MDSNLLKFHHLGLASKNPIGTKRALNSIGYRILNDVYDPLQKVSLCMCIHGSMPSIEIVFNSEDEESPINNILKSHNEIIYHTCYETNDLELAISQLKNESRVITVSSPQKAIMFNNKLVSFYYVRNLGLIEIIQTDGR